MTLQNTVLVAPNILEYDVILTNSGTTTIALRGYTWGINHGNGMSNGGVITHSFITRDTALIGFPSIMASYTAATNHLRVTTTNVTSGNEVNLVPNQMLELQLCA